VLYLVRGQVAHGALAKRGCLPCSGAYTSHIAIGIAIETSGFAAATSWVMQKRVIIIFSLWLQTAKLEGVPHPQKPLSQVTCNDSSLVDILYARGNIDCSA